MLFRKSHVYFAALAGGLVMSSFSARAGEDLGNVMYVGDSLTNGSYTPLGYRYQLMKIFVDNETQNKSTGVWKTTQSYTDEKTTYRGVKFRDNDSVCAFSGRRASQTAGVDNKGGGGVSDNSSIQNWFGFSDKKLDGTQYKGTILNEANGNLPDLMLVLMGTNDLVTNYGKTVGNTVADTVRNVQTIVAAGQRANASLQSVVMSVPVWSSEGVNPAYGVNGYSKEVKANVDSYNTQMAEWAKTQNNVRFIDINKGISDVTNAYGLGVDGMYYRDGSAEKGLHFSDQGNLIIAGNIARGLGLAGRTAGQQRKSSGDLALSFKSGGMTVENLLNSGFSKTGTVDNGVNKIVFANSGFMESTWASGEAASGFSVDISFQILRRDETNFTLDNIFSIQLGNGAVSGTLTISEAFIKWGNVVLYSIDATQEMDDLRIAYVAASGEGDAVQSGFYIWLGDQLIGEACSGSAGGMNGVKIGGGDASLYSLSMDGKGSYAPVSAFVSVPEPSISLFFCAGMSGILMGRRRKK